MKLQFRNFTFLLLTLLSAPGINAINHATVKFNNEASDTTFITSILIEASQQNLTNSAERIDFLTKKFIGKPYKAGTLESEKEEVTVNMDEFDCTTFVESIIAMAITLDEHRTSWRDLVFNLEKIRYRNGECNGYASRLHYVSDWIVDNTYRGNMEEVTERIIVRSDSKIKTIDYMTANREKYPALKDDATFEKMKSVEIGFRSHRIPYIKGMNLGSARLQSGDIIAITTNLKNLDVSHMGILTIINGTPHMIHASSKAGKIIIDPLPLAEWLKRSRTNTGIRVIRLKE